MTPEQKGFAVGELRRREIGAKGKAEAGVAVPVAHVCGRDPVRTAQDIEETCQPAHRVINRSAAACALRQGDGLGTIPRANSQEFLCDIAKRFIPGDFYPTRVGVAFGPRTFQRIVKTVGMVEELRGSLALDAHHSTIRVFGIWVEASHPAILNGCNGGAVSRAESTVTTNRVGVCSEVSHRQRGEDTLKHPRFPVTLEHCHCLTGKVDVS
jgi:hypothetical protein